MCRLHCTVWEQIFRQFNDRIYAKAYPTNDVKVARDVNARGKLSLMNYWRAVQRYVILNCLTLQWSYRSLKFFHIIWGTLFIKRRDLEFCNFSLSQLPHHYYYSPCCCNYFSVVQNSEKCALWLFFSLVHKPKTFPWQAIPNFAEGCKVPLINLFGESPINQHSRLLLKIWMEILSKRKWIKSNGKFQIKKVNISLDLTIYEFGRMRPRSKQRTWCCLPLALGKRYTGKEQSAVQVSRKLRLGSFGLHGIMPSCAFLSK